MLLPVELKGLEKHASRVMVVETGGERVDGRVANGLSIMVKNLTTLPLVHGSGLFSVVRLRVLSICTHGMLNEWQRLDTIEPMDGNATFTTTTSHHSAGETGRRQPKAS